MKNTTKGFLLALVACSTSAVFAQKAVETSAAVEKGNFENAFMSQDLKKAKASLEKAKKFIDEAAVHPDTKESPKTLWLKGDIYFSALLMKGLDSTSFPDITEESLNTAISSWNAAYANKKFKPNVEESVEKARMMIETGAVGAYNQKMFPEAMGAYDMLSQISTAVNKVDTTSIYYAGVCAESAKDWDNAVKYYTKCADYGYKVPDIYRSIAGALINAGKKTEATAFIEKALEKSPNDKELYYVIGTFYMEAGDNDKAVAALQKAVSIDPKYWDAQYQLGAHLQSMGSKLRTEASAMKPGDPNFDKVMAQSDEYYRQALPPLEAYIAAYPTERAVLLSLSQLHRALKNTEKALEYKKRYDEAP